MPATALCQATVRRAFASPVGLLVACGALAAWLLQAVLAPLGIRPTNTSVDEVIYEIALMSAALGVALGTAARKELEPLVEIRSPRVGPGLDGIAIAVTALLFTSLSVMAPVALARVGFGRVAGVVPFLAASAAWGALALRITPRRGAAGWVALLGALALSAAPSAGYTSLRAGAFAAASLLGARLLDRRPGELR